MKLQEFVNETLREIIGGVKKAQAYAAKHGADINPAAATRGPGKKRRVPAPSGGFLEVQEVEFDVAVTSANASEKQIGAGVVVARFSIGAKGKSDTSNSCVNRIKFSVPMALPVQ